MPKRSISEFGGNPDLEFLQRKISAAGEMKTAIKKFLDEFEYMNRNHDLEKCYADECQSVFKRIKKLKKSMEDYLNA